MRTWRKVYSSLLESEQVAALSEGALNFFLFLIIAQDDSGYYPWTDSKLRRITATRPQWSRNDFDTWRNELVKARLVVEQDGGVVLVNGTKLNGVPRSDVKAELYLRNEIVTPRIESGTLEQSRVDKIRVEETPPKSPSRRGTHKGVEVTPEFIEAMVTEFKERLGGEERTREVISEAMNHVAMDKRKDKRLYLRGWLRREGENLRNTNGRVGHGQPGQLGLPNPRKSASQGDFSDTSRYTAEADRLRREGPLPA